MASSKRQAFTLVELLVVVAIIGMLMALLLPAVTQAIGSARRAHCENNQHQVAQALQLYETNNGRFPGFVNLLPNRPSGNQIVSWVVTILPELQRRDIYDTWNSPTPTSAANSIELLVCPVDTQTTIGGPWLSYVVNCGQPGDMRPAAPSAPRADGIFFDRALANPLDMTMGYVTANDGTSTTIMLSENLRAWKWNVWYRMGAPERDLQLPAPGQLPPLYGPPPLPTPPLLVAPPYFSLAIFPPDDYTSFEIEAGFNWDAADVAPSPNAATRVINRVVQSGTWVSIPNFAASAPAEARPSSGHPGGVVAMFVDGHSIFLSENVDRDIFKLMCTPNGKVASPQQFQMLIESDFQK